MSENMDFSILEVSHHQNLILSLPLPALASTAFTAVRYQNAAEPSNVNSISRLSSVSHSLQHLIFTMTLGGWPTRVIAVILILEMSHLRLRAGAGHVQSHSKQEVELRLNLHLLTPSSEPLPSG